MGFKFREFAIREIAKFKFRSKCSSWRVVFLLSVSVTVIIILKPRKSVSETDLLYGQWKYSRTKTRRCSYIKWIPHSIGQIFFFRIQQATWVLGMYWIQNIRPVISRENSAMNASNFSQKMQQPFISQNVYVSLELLNVATKNLDDAHVHDQRYLFLWLHIPHRLLGTLVLSSLWIAWLHDLYQTLG